MDFIINFKDRQYCYNLGDSKAARHACEGLELYKSTSQYGDLRRIFANLSWIVSEGNPHNKQACLATQALASSVFSTLDSDYKQLFVANSVSSICVKTNTPIPESWQRAENIRADRLSRAFDQNKALDAGLACIDPSSGNVAVSPIPEYTRSVSNR